MSVFSSKLVRNEHSFQNSLFVISKRWNSQAITYSYCQLNQIRKNLLILPSKSKINNHLCECVHVCICAQHICWHLMAIVYIFILYCFDIIVWQERANCNKRMNRAHSTIHIQVNELHCCYSRFNRHCLSKTILSARQSRNFTQFFLQFLFLENKFPSFSK